MQDKSIRYLRSTMHLLMVLSLGLLLWHHFGMSRVLRFDAQSTVPVVACDDHDQGGTSVAILSRSNNALLLNSTVNKSSFPYPFGETRFEFSKEGEGIDLSGFDRMVFDVRLTGKDLNRIRVFLRNYEPQFSNLNNPMSLKVNELEFDLPAGKPYSVPLNLFHVAPWWAEQMHIPLLNTDVRIDNVVQMGIVTPEHVDPGSYGIEIRSIEFQGKWISQTQLLSGIVIAWLLFGFIWILIELRAYRASYLIKRAQMSELEIINQVLELKTAELSEQVLRDPLTGAFNREGLRDFLLKQWQGEHPTNSGMSMIFVDLDHFKMINDRFGHTVGDAVLKKFANLVKGQIRQADGLVRWGGEEFLVVCPNTKLEHAVQLAEKLRVNVESVTWSGGADVTCSCGVVTRIESEDFSMLVERADAALYRAKNGGRNRVEVG